ncbi:MAG: tRNA (guanosine(37)-N1)-methyltransferase TrmD [Armatimonadetes bacterium]|nr:tRNA (guanosine(37)-N1)-methyltransferase TrmD [Armatimonadota bacterium]
MRFDLISAVPAIFDGWREASILARGQEAGAIEIAVHDLRDWATDRHRTLDDYPYGGGAGMVLKVEPLAAAIEAVSALTPEPAEVILLTPQGEVFDQALARELARRPRLVLVCGRYEGVDERVREHLVTREVSIGDFVVTGGELPAMVVVDAVARLVPGVLGAAESAEDESFSEPLLEYPQYTRPVEFKGWRVPGELLSGHHERVRLWRRMQQLQRTLERRPDLLSRRRLTNEDRRLLARLL